MVVVRECMVMVGTGSKITESVPGGERMVRLVVVLVSVISSSSNAGMSERRAPRVGCVPRTRVRAVAVGGGLPAWRSERRRGRVGDASGARCSSDMLGDFSDVVKRVPVAPVEAVVLGANIVVGTSKLCAEASPGYFSHVLIFSIGRQVH